MAQAEDPLHAAARLEAALERIAFAADRLGGAAEAAPHPALGEVASRLDGLIAQLRRVLATTSEGTG